MSRRPPWIFFGVVFLLISFLEAAQEWNSDNFPNPTAGQFRECNMKTTASICDPDKILTESQRYRLNHELNQLEARTRQDHARSFCEKKGVTGAMAVAKHFRGGSEQAVKAAANEMLKKWDLDRQCQKVIVIVLATEDRKFWVARGDRVPVYAEEFTELFNQQKTTFKSGNYEQGLLNILQGTWEKALSKQTGAPDSGRGSSGGGKQPSFDGGDSGRSGMQDFKMPKIPWGVIIAIVLIVIPIILCCCCIYCCCCRGKGGSSNRRQDVEGGDGGMMGDGGGQGSRGGGLGGFLGGMGGSAALNGIMGLVRNRSGGRGGGVPMGPVGGGGHPTDGASPTRHGDNPEGKGLYPSVAKADEGGGGSW